MANNRCKTGLDSIAANPSGLPHLPAQGPGSPPQTSPHPPGLWSHCQAPGTHHIFAQNHTVVLGDCLSSPYVHSGGCSQDLLSVPKRLPEAASTYKQMALLMEKGILFINVSTYNLCI